MDQRNSKLASERNAVAASAPPPLHPNTSSRPRAASSGASSSGGGILKKNSSYKRKYGTKVEVTQGVFLEGVKGREVVGDRIPAQLLSGGYVQYLAAKTPIPKNGGHVSMGGEAPEPVVFPEEGRSLHMHARVGTVRILNKRRSPC